MPLLSVTLTLFLLMDSFGNIPLFLSILSPFNAKTRKRILIREMLIALLIILLFQWGGSVALELLGIEGAAMNISGGIILFLIAIRMIFSPTDPPKKVKKEEPFIVPLAVPLVAGPATLAAVTILGHKWGWMLISIAIVISWMLSCLVLLGSTYLQKILGRRGLLAMEKLMGLILTLMAVQMVIQGIRLFVTS